MKLGSQNSLAKKISRRYAQALFNLSLENKIIEEVHGEVIFLVETLQSSPDLRDFIRDPHHPNELCEATITELFKNKIQPLTFDFLLLLIRKSRFVILNEILTAFLAIYHQYHRITKIQIISAAELLPQQVDAICKRLRARRGHEFFAETSINPELIGGFQIKSGDEVLDFSMKNQLENFRRQVINA